MTPNKLALAADAWRDMEVAADAKGELECYRLTLPIEKVRALVAERRATTVPPDVRELVERLLQDHVQLGKMASQAQFIADGMVRVKDPSALMTDLYEAATAILSLSADREAAKREGMEEAMAAIGKSGCPHDMGWDREHGPLGCSMDPCACLGCWSAIRNHAGGRADG